MMGKQTGTILLVKTCMCLLYHSTLYSISMSSVSADLICENSTGESLILNHCFTGLSVGLFFFFSIQHHRFQYYVISCINTCKG